MKPLIDYYTTATDAVVSGIKSVNWIRVSKLLLVVPLALIWTPLYYAINYIHKGAVWFNTAGGDLIEEFMND
jgi:hypothetical protein